MIPACRMQDAETGVMLRERANADQDEEVRYAALQVIAAG